MRNFILAFLLSVAAVAQVQTGTPPFSSLTGGPDIINLGNLNVHWDIPFLAKQGRGLPVNYGLRFDNSSWYIASGYANWQLVVNTGWQQQGTAVVGWMNHHTLTRPCDHNGNYIFYYDSYVYYDSYGTEHHMPGVLSYNSCTAAWTGTGTFAFNDGSGMSVRFVQSATPQSLMLRDGTVLTNIPMGTTTIGGTATITDRNGNKLSVTNSTVTDTLGSSAITITGSAPTVNYSYYDTTNTSRNITVSYTQYTLQTHFQCSGVSETTQTGVYLPASISYPSGQEYLFSYEQTPGYGVGYTTGRLSQITLPTGGTISYAYPGANDGTSCTDGSTVSMTRTTSDGTWTYSRSGTQTQITDPAGNVTTIQFQSGYETERDIYSGSSNLLSTIYTCYNGAAYPCNSTSVTLPIAQVTTTTNLNGWYGQTSNTFDTTYGMLLNTYDYDFGSGAPGSLLRETDRTYATISGPLATVYDRASDIKIKNVSGTVVAETTYTYDASALTQTSSVVQHDYTDFPYTATARGNATTLSQWVSGSNWISTTNTFDDTGELLTSTDALSHQTVLSYADNYSDGTNHNTNAFVTQITYPNTGVAHIVKQKYYYPSGLVDQSTDQNNQITTYNYDSALRPSSTGYPDGGVTNYLYPNAQQVEVQKKIDSTRWTDDWTEVDPLGRLSRRSTANGGESGGSYDQVDTCYNVSSMNTFSSYPYQGSGIASGANGTKQCSTGDTTSYDALGRTVSVTHSTDTSNPVSYAYNGRATSVQDEGNGSYKVTHVYQADGLGRNLTVCELSSISLISLGGVQSPASCSLDLSGSGFTTSYTYDPLGNILTVSQGSLQQRVMSYDGLSHLVSEFIPEANSTTSYGYDGVGRLSTRTRPSPNQSSTYATTATYGYDALSRLTQIQYSDTNPSPPYITPTVTLSYDQTSVWGHTLINTTGRLTSTSVGTGSRCGADALTYDSMGRLLSEWQQTPYYCGSGGNLQFANTYNYDGTMHTSTNGEAVTFTYTYSIGERLTQLTTDYPNSPATLVSGAHYNAFGETLSDSLGNGINETATFDVRGRITSVSAVKNGTTIYSLTGPGSGNTVQYSSDSNITGANDSVNGNWTYSYDPLNRVHSAGKSGDSLTYSDSQNGSTIDRNGNRWIQYINGGAQPSLTFNQNTNQIASSSSVTYDAAGNVRTWNDGVMTHTYTYDAEGQLVSLDAASVTYTYDAFGRRIEKNVNGTKDDYFYDVNGNMITDLNGVTGIWNRGEVWAGRHLATFAYVTTYFANQDLLRTDRVRTDVNGNIVQSCTSNPYGDSFTCSGSVSSLPAQFAGMDYDSETGFYHAVYRYYNPRLGGWMTPDPAGLDASDGSDPQTLNRYAYVLNTPINGIDPLGLRCGEDLQHPCHEGAWAGGSFALQWVQVGSYVTVTSELKSTQITSSVTYNDQELNEDYSLSNMILFSTLKVIPIYASIYSLSVGGGGQGRGNNGPRQTKRQCIQSALQNKFGSFVANHLIPDFSLYSLAGGLSGIWNFAKGSVVSWGTKGVVGGAPLAYGKILTVTGRNLLEYPGMAAAGADALEAGAYWTSIGTASAETLGGAAIALTAFATGADYWARQQCKNVP